VRRRCWKPIFKDEQGTLEEEALGAQATTMVEAAKLGEQEIFETDIGPISLEALASAFLADDWLDGGLMTTKFASQAGHDIEVGPWASGIGAAAQVRGKLRTLAMRLPPPPAPMCPKETRISATYHVLSEPGEVILESSTMSLDVPYGMYFNVMVCDTFTINENTGHLQMARSFALQWLKSSWMQSVIESKVPDALVQDARSFADVIRKWGPVFGA